MPSPDSRNLALVAIGGNSLISHPDRQAISAQDAAAVETCRHLAALVAQGQRIVITHGNGPQVGFLLRQSELARGEVPEAPLDVCGADTQGAIGYMLQKALRNELRRHLSQVPPIVSLVTQTVVDGSDPSFSRPTKPIGSFMTEAVARSYAEKEGWTIQEDSGRGWRRVVASPQPKRIVELDAIRSLLRAGAIVIAAGGGGIPVVEESNGNLRGVAAVIDKDLASSLLAHNLEVNRFAISTAVPHVCRFYGKPQEESLGQISVQEAKRFLEEGHFAPGSMKPKVEAVVRYLENGGEEALITDPAHLADAFAGLAGTRITR